LTNIDEHVKLERNKFGGLEMEEKNFNRNHPELREGEVWLTNIWTDDQVRIGHATKRVGVTAYDIYGQAVQGMLPVFVQKTELEEKGIPLPS
jgi:hypothetical protein